ATATRAIGPVTRIRTSVRTAGTSSGAPARCVLTRRLPWVTRGGDSWARALVAPATARIATSQRTSPSRMPHLRELSELGGAVLSAGCSERRWRRRDQAGECSWRIVAKVWRGVSLTAGRAPPHAG